MVRSRRRSPPMAHNMSRGVRLDGLARVLGNGAAASTLAVVTLRCRSCSTTHANRNQTRHCTMTATIIAWKTWQ